MHYLYYGGWGFMILSIIISLAAEINVKTTFSKYSKQTNSMYITGAEAARRILDANGLYDVQIVRTSGTLTDYYSPKEKIVALSDSVYGSTSISAVGVAAHECGHAVQYKEGYFPIKLRNFIIPISQFGSKFWYLCVILGLILGNGTFGNFFLYFGIILFSLICIFQFITLPVEFNASSRALQTLEGYNILTDTENKKSAKVLMAAALTYVASLATSLLQLLRLVTMANKRRR